MKKKRNEKEKGSGKKEQKKSTICLYCIDVKLAPVKKRRERKKEGRRACFIDEGTGNQLRKCDCYRAPSAWD